MQEQQLTSQDKLTVLIKKTGVKTWLEAIELVRALPYGRNENRADFNLVIIEQKGTCSSKHAMLKKLADLNKIPNIALILCIYRMTEKNTPKIGNILTKNAIDCIPEAHCYLKVAEQRMDLTTTESDFSHLKKDVLKEIEIQPEQVSTFKVLYHQDFIKNWLKTTNSPYQFKHIWSIREKCIENLIV